MMLKHTYLFFYADDEVLIIKSVTHRDFNTMIKVRIIYHEIKRSLFVLSTWLCEKGTEFEVGCYDGIFDFVVLGISYQIKSPATLRVLLQELILDL